MGCDHDWEKVCSVYEGYDVYIVYYWCNICGGLIRQDETDGRVFNKKSWYPKNFEKVVEKA